MLLDRGPCWDGRVCAPCPTPAAASLPSSGLSDCGYTAICQTWGLFHRLNFIPVEVTPGFLHQRKPARSHLPRR